MINVMTGIEQKLKMKYRNKLFCDYVNQRNKATKNRNNGNSMEPGNEIEKNEKNDVKSDGENGDATREQQQQKNRNPTPIAND